MFGRSMIGDIKAGQTSLVTLRGSDEKLHPAIFERMYRARYDVYVARRGWQDLHRPDLMERDHFDTGHARYVLLVDGGGRVDAGLRLLPSDRPHLLADVFAHLVKAAVPRGQHIRELTRLFVTKHGGRPDRLERLCEGMFALCREEGIRALTAVVDTCLLRRMRGLGWQFELLGEAAPYREGIAVAVLIQVPVLSVASTTRALS